MPVGSSPPEESLSRDAAGFHLLFERGPQPMWICDRESMAILLANAAARDRYGYSQEEFLARGIADLAASRDGNPFQGAVRHRARDGAELVVELSAQELFFEGRDAVLVVAHDVTDRVQVEMLYRSASERLQYVLDSAPIMVYTLRVTPEGPRMTWVSERLRDLLGFDPRGFAIADWQERIHPDDRERVLSEQPQLLERGRLAQEYRLRHRDGSYRWVHDRQRLVHDREGQPEEVIGVCMDITEQKQTVVALHESEQQFRKLVEQSLVGIYMVQGERLVYLNPRFAEAMGYSPDDFLTGYRIADLVVEEDRDLVKRMVDLRLAGNVESVQYSFRARKRGGEVVELEAHGSLTSIGGEPAIIGILVDVTERNRAEQALRQSEERLALALEGTGQGLWDFNLATGEIFADARSLQMLGYESGKVRPTLRLIASRMHPEDRRDARERLQLHLRGELPFFEAECRLRARDGSWKWFLHRGRVVERAGEQPVRLTGTLLDITDKKRLEQALRRSEEQLHQSQKMEAVGRLAGGIAHDFNNLLTVITGFATLLQLEMEPEGEAARDLQEILSAADRAAALNQQLLAFSRKQVLQPEVVNLNERVHEMEKMLRRLIGEDVEMIVRLAPDVGPVRVDPAQMGQVILNLAVNARDAMPQGGRITLATCNVRLSSDRIASPEVIPAGAYVRLRVSDTGCGMDDATRQRIFEPFFTTKPEGVGTGLGLATVYGIVKQSGGYISVETAPGHGTTFDIYLPRLNAAHQTRPEARPAAPAARGTGTVLVVEDEDAVRTLALRILRQGGYTVLTARNGYDALAISDRYPRPIDLLLTDVVLPGISGRELADRLVPRFPGMRLLYISGHTDDRLVHYGIADNRMPFLQKPFRPETLLQKVHELLSAG